MRNLPSDNVNWNFTPSYSPGLTVNRKSVPSFDRVVSPGNSSCITFVAAALSESIIRSRYFSAFPAFANFKAVFIVS